MPAPSWSALQDYELQFDAALNGSDDFALSPASPILLPFTQAPYAFAIFPQQSVDALTHPRIEFQFTLGQPAGPARSVHQRTSPATRRITSWNFTLLFRFVYERNKLVAAQRGFKGALRELLGPPPNDIASLAAFNSTTLPWLEITALNESRAIRGLVSGAEGAKQLDAWETLWDGIFTIRPSAMPD